MWEICVPERALEKWPERARLSLRWLATGPPLQGDPDKTGCCKSGRQDTFARLSSRSSCKAPNHRLAS